MLFNSYTFMFLYLTVALLGFFQLARISHAYAAAWLALSSLFFYGYWNPAYIGLFLASIAFAIRHHKEMMPQLAKHATYRFNYQNLSIGGLKNRLLWRTLVGANNSAALQMNLSMFIMQKNNAIKNILPISGKIPKTRTAHFCGHPASLSKHTS